MIKKDAFGASVDLKDGFYSVPVAAHHQKYLKFFTNEYLKFNMPNGYGPAMTILYKDHESTIFSSQDAGPYLSCICRQCLYTSKLL